MFKATPFSCKPLFALLLFIAANAAAQPKISSFSPVSGPLGTTVTISGTNFNATPSANKVLFGSVQAPVTGGTTTSLTVTVPGGTTYKPLSVLNTATGLTAYATAPFITTFANPSGTGFPPNYYQPPIGFATDYAPISTAIADIDGDGKPDLAVGNFVNVSVLRNVSATGSLTPYSFASRVNIGTNGYGIGGITLVDLDGDGKPEIIATQGPQSDIAVVRNTSTVGNISFDMPVTPPLSTRSSRVSVGDVDGDGKPDLVFGSSEQGSFSVVRNLSTPGTLSFAAKVDFATGGGAGEIAIGDLNGDGKPDVAVSIGSSTLSLFRNTATQGSISATSFAAKTDFNIGSNINGVRIGDLNADGKPDLALTNAPASALSVLQNTTPSGASQFSFAAKVDFASGASSNGVEISDLDGDGRPDLLGYSSGLASVLRNLTAAGSPITAASFAAKSDYSTGDFGNSAVAGDLDGDGIPEIAATNSSSYSVSVLKVSGTAAPGAGAPQISAISPRTGLVGTNVTISGSNFNPAPAGNIVYFGATRAIVNSSSAVSLTVTAPTGATYQPVSVENADNGLTGYSPLPFDVAFGGYHANYSSLPTGYYRPKVDFAAGTLPFYVALSDLDGDGKADLVVANSVGSVSVLPNTSSSGNAGALSFGTRFELSAAGEPRSVAIGDLDGDGKPDIVASNSNDGSLSVLRNRSVPGTLNGGSFSPEVRLRTGSTPYSVAVGDVDGDGKPDLVAANFADGTISVLRNIASRGNLVQGSFAPAVNFPAGMGPRSVIVQDVNGDGKSDIAVVNEKANTVSILRNTATTGVVNAASFASPVSFATGNSPNCIAAGDFDNDGRTDLAVSNYGSNSVSVLRNTANAGTIDAGSFAAKLDFATGQQPFFVATGDADGDSRIDLLVANAGSGNLSVLPNVTSPGNTNPSFAPATAFGSGGYPVCVALGDIDGDNIAELISVNAGSNTVSLLRIAVTPAPMITSFSPASGPAGTQVTITGENLSLNTAVYFGTEVATVVSTSTNSITVTAPAGATYRPLSVSASGGTSFSSKPFVLTFPNPFGTGIPANFYRPKVDIASNNSILYAVAFGDLDQDGKLDMVGVNRADKNIVLLRNISATGSITPSSFGPAVNIPVTTRPQDVTIIDVNGDRRLDLLITNPEDNSFSLYLNNISPADNSFGTNSFYSGGNYSVGTYISSLAVDDLDRDGRPDVVTTNLYAGTISVLRNISSGTFNSPYFTSPVSFPAGMYPRSVAISDIDGDGKRDLVVANERGNSVSVFRNLISLNSITPNSFAPRVDFLVGTNPPSVAVGDVDGDNKPDIVVANYGSSSVSVLRNTSTAGAVDGNSFAAKADFATGLNPIHLAMGDADGDGKVDLVTANANANTISVLRNISSMGSINPGSFAGKADFGANGYPLYIALGDLDGDGVAEAAAVNAGTGTVSVFKINSPAGAATTAGAAASVLTATAGDLMGTTMQLYPNPTRGEFTVQLTGVKGSVASMEVFTESGKTIERRTVNTGEKAAVLRLSLRQHPAGVYYVKLTGVGGVQVVKVVVQR